MAFLTGPTDLPKYSYSKKLGIESVHWYAVKRLRKEHGRMASKPKEKTSKENQDQSSGSLLLEHQRASSKR